MEKISDIVLKENERKLFISRVPKEVKKEFIDFANEEFCEDYGMAFKNIWDSFKIYKIFFENVDYKLDHIIGLISNSEQKPEENVKKIKFLDGRTVEKGGQKK